MKNLVWRIEHRGIESRDSEVEMVSLFLTIAHPLGTIFFSPQPSAVIKIEDGSFNFH